MKEKIKLFREALKLVFKSAPGWTIVNIVLSVLRSVLPLLLVWLLKLLVDEISSASAGGTGIRSENLLLLIIAVVAVYFFDEATSDLNSFVRKKQSVKLEAYMYGLLHSKAIRLDLINFERPEYFDCLARASREAPWRPNSILNNLVSVLRGMLSLLLMAGLISTLNWTLALLLLAANVPGIWFRFHFAGIIYNFQRQQTPEARKTAYFNWLLTGDRPSRELRLFGLGNYFHGLFNKSFLKQKEEEITILKKRTIVELTSTLFKASALLVSILLIVSSTVRGELSLGQMAMFLVAFRQGLIYIRELFTSFGGLYEDSLFIGDTFEFLNLEEKIVAAEPLAAVSPLGNRIVADGLSFTYPGNNTPTIDNVSFELRKGEIVALVGPNGAGKSTLVRLLCRLYDADSGRLTYDGNDIRHFEPEEYRKMFSVVFQDFMLYNLSAGENIRMGDIDEGNPGPGIRSSAGVSGIDKLIESLPEGYDTAIGNLFENSRELSWGEWQKIALSRALFRQAPVLILDEPSSSLDAETEYEIFSRFRDLVKGRTTILISHRFTNVSLADRIIVLDKGAIAETGTHKELMKKGGIYCDMYTKQAGRFA